MRQTVRPTVAPAPTLTRQSQPSTDLLTCANEACRPDLHRNRAPTLVHRTVMPDYRGDHGFPRLFIGGTRCQAEETPRASGLFSDARGNARGIGIRTCRLRNGVQSVLSLKTQ